MRGAGHWGREENCPKMLFFFFFCGKRHDNKILKMQILYSENLVVVAQAPNWGGWLLGWVVFGVIHHQFVSQYGSHLYRDAFAEVLGSGVVGTLPIPLSTIVGFPECLLGCSSVMTLNPRSRCCTHGQELLVLPLLMVRQKLQVKRPNNRLRSEVCEWPPPPTYTAKIWTKSGQTMTQNVSKQGKLDSFGPYFCSYFGLVCGGWGFKVIPHQREGVGH